MVAISVVPVPIPIAAVPAVAAAVAITPVAVVPAEGPLGVMDGGAHGRADLLACRPGLGFGVVRSGGDRLAQVLRPGVVPRPAVPVPVAVAVAITPVAVAVATPVCMVVPVAAVAVAITEVSIAVAAVPAVAAAVAVVVVPIPIASMPVAVAVVPAEGPLGVMDGGAHGRADLLACRPGLGFGVVRSGGDRLAQVPFARTTASIGMTASAAVMAIPVTPVAVAVAAVAAVAAPIPVAAAAASVGVPASITVVATPISAVSAVAVAVAPFAAPSTRVGPALASAAVPAATAALRERDVVGDRRERTGQPAQERDQCDHDDCQDQSSNECSHGDSPSTNHAHTAQAGLSHQTG